MSPDWRPLATALRGTAITAVINYFAFRNACGKTKDDPVSYDIRDSLLFRAQSIGFHLDLLHTHFEHFSAHANERLASRHRDPSFLMNARNLLSYLSDDVLFNTISMLDYLANLVGHLHAGQAQIKWNGLIRSAQDSKNPLSREQSAKVALGEDREWIDRLHKVRSEIIHYQMKLGNGSRTIRFETGRPEVSLFFEFPPAILRRIEFLQVAATNGPLSLGEGIVLIAHRGLRCANRVAAALAEDMTVKRDRARSVGGPEEAL